MKIYILTAEHFHVPGLICKVFAEEALAVAEAVSLVNVMNDDEGRGHRCGASNWSEHVERLQETHGAAHCYVEIAETDLIGAALPDHANDTVTVLEQARDAIQEAMDVHIYDADQGEEPEPDCGYVATVKALDAAIIRERARPDLLAALKECRATMSTMSEQISQMEGMFNDDDGAIAAAMEDYENAHAMASRVIDQAEGRANG